MNKKFITGDRVIIITGKDKKKIGKIIEINKEKTKVKIEGLVLKTFFKKKDKRNNQPGERLIKEGWIDISNISHINSNNEKIKVKIIRDSKILQLVNKKTGEILREKKKQKIKIRKEEISKNINSEEILNKIEENKKEKKIKNRKENK